MCKLTYRLHVFFVAPEHYQTSNENRAVSATTTAKTDVRTGSTILENGRGNCAHKLTAYSLNVNKSVIICVVIHCIDAG